MILTHSHIEQLSSSDNCVAMNTEQLQALGISYPPKHGWIKGLVGKYIPDDQFQLALKLRGIRKRSERRAVAQNQGTLAF